MLVNAGAVAEAAIILALLRKGYQLLKPLLPSCRYDLAIDRNGTLIRIQIKHGKYDSIRGVIKFNTCSTTPLTGKHQDYRGEAEYFGVYCSELDKCYLIPVSLVGLCSCWLRVVNVKRKYKNIRHAADYEI